MRWQAQGIASLNVVDAIYIQKDFGRLKQYDLNACLIYALVRYYIILQVQGFNFVFHFVPTQVKAASSNSSSGSTANHYGRLSLGNLKLCTAWRSMMRDALAFGLPVATQVMEAELINCWTNS